MDLPGGKDSECWQPEAEGHNLLGPGDCISCQAVSRLYSWAATNHDFLRSGTVYGCQECHNLRATPLRRCTAHHAWTVSLWSIWETDQNEPEQWEELRLLLHCSSARKTWSTRNYDITAILKTWVALWKSVLWNILEPEQLGPGKCIRQRAHPGLCSGRTPGHFGLGIAGDAWLNWDWAFIEHPEVWAARALEVQETKNPPGTVPQTENWGVWTAWAWEEQEIHGSTGAGPSYNTWESEQLGPGKCRRHTANLGLHA